MPRSEQMTDFMTQLAQACKNAGYGFRFVVGVYVFEPGHEDDNGCKLMVTGPELQKAVDAGGDAVERLIKDGVQHAKEDIDANAEERKSALEAGSQASDFLVTTEELVDAMIEQVRVTGGEITEAAVRGQAGGSIMAVLQGSVFLPGDDQPTLIREFPVYLSDVDVVEMIRLGQFVEMLERLRHALDRVTLAGAQDDPEANPSGGIPEEQPTDTASDDAGAHADSGDGGQPSEEATAAATADSGDAAATAEPVTDGDAGPNRNSADPHADPADGGSVSS